MIPSTFQRVLTVAVAGVFVLLPGLAMAQGQPASKGSGQQQPAGQPTSQPQQTQDPSQWPSQWPQPTPPPPPPQTTPTPQATSQPPQKTAADQPVQQKDTVTPKNSKEDVEAIGNRGIGKGVNFYSLEREIALGKSLAQEVAHLRIRVNAISPGYVDTPILADKPHQFAQWKESIVLGRFADPAEIARAMCFLLSTDSSYCCGAELVIDGGYSLR